MSTADLAGWMVFKVINNRRFLFLNDEAVAMVIKPQMIEKTCPEGFADVRHRQIENTAIIKAVFRLIILMEAAATLLLMIGTCPLGASHIRMFPADIATSVALLGTLDFVLNWTGVLIGGEHFCYWYCHFGSQAMHSLLA